MNVIATAKIIAAKTRFREVPPTTGAVLMGLQFARIDGCGPPRARPAW
jgi:hypothetical protein